MPSPCRCKILISKIISPVSIRPPNPPEGQVNSWASFQPATRVSFTSPLSQAVRWALQSSAWPSTTG